MLETASVYKWLENALYAIYPTRCVLCGQPGGERQDLCPACLHELPFIQYPCSRCAAPLTTDNGICGACQQHPPVFRHSIIPLHYASPLDHLLQQLKFHQQLHLAPLLGNLLADAVQSRETALPELLLPVPLHARRISERGYNQALELSRPIAKRLGIPLGHHQVRRLRYTAAQTSLQANERRKNLRNAFAVMAELPQHVAIVDDVVTTGATVTELARTLRRNGVEVIDIWAVARAGGN